MAHIFAVFSCLFSLIALSIAILRKNKRESYATVFSVIGILSGFIAISIAAPRDMSKLGIDYLGIIVALLAAFATLLLGMQLYHGLRLKEDADEVMNAKETVQKYANDIKHLTDTIHELVNQKDELQGQVADLQEKIKMLGISYIDNPEWLYAIIDAEKHLLFGIRRQDGSIEWSAGIPTPIRKELVDLSLRIKKLENQSANSDM